MFRRHDCFDSIPIGGTGGLSHMDRKVGRSVGTGTGR